MDLEPYKGSIDLLKAIQEPYGLESFDLSSAVAKFILFNTNLEVLPGVY